MNRMRSALAVGIAYPVCIYALAVLFAYLERWAGRASWTLLLGAFNAGAAWCATPALLLASAIPILRPALIVEIIGLATYACYGLLVGFVWPTPIVRGCPTAGAIMLRCGLFVLLVWSVGVYVLAFR